MKPFQVMRMRQQPSGGATDPDFSSVVSLLHMDGTNGSTTFTDVKGLTWSASGVAEVSTSSPKFGSGSLSLGSSGSWISTTGSTDFAFGTGDFTVEAWIKQSGVDKVVFDFYDGSVANCWEFYITGSGGLAWYSSNGAGAALVLQTSGATVNGATWNHIAASRTAGVLNLCIDGTVRGTVSDTRNYSATQPLLAIGAQVNVRSSPYDFVGNIDDVRITKGVGRYPANFTPPAVPFPNS